MPAKIMEMTDQDHPGLDCALECAAGEYPKSILNKVEFAMGLQTDTAEIVNECIKSVKNFGSVGVTGKFLSCLNPQYANNDRVSFITVLSSKLLFLTFFSVYAGFCNHFNIGAVMEKGVRFIGNVSSEGH